MGSDLVDGKTIFCLFPISIHAPRMGSDRGSPHYQREVLYFNPRSPHGERHELAARAYALI